MIKMIVYEFKKHFFKPSMIIIILIFIVIDIGKIYLIYNENSIFSKKNQHQFNEPFKLLYAEFGSEITDEKIRKLMDIYRPIKEIVDSQTASTDYNPDSYTYNVYSDELFFRWCFTDEMEYDYLYKYYANDIVALAKENMEFYQGIGNQYEYKKNLLIANKFYNRKIESFMYTEMYQYYLYYDFSILFIFLICIYGLVNVFVLEKESEMNYILSTTKLGGNKTVIAKILSSLLFTIGLCCIFKIIDFISFSFFFKSIDGSNPLYALEGFKNTPFNMTLIQYTFFSTLIMILGMMIISLLIVFISTLFNKTLLPFVFSMICIVMLMRTESRTSSIVMMLMNPMILIQNRSIFQHTEFVSLFDSPIPIHVLAILVFVLEFFILVLCIHFITKKSGGNKNASNPF